VGLQFFQTPKLSPENRSAVRASGESYLTESNLYQQVDGEKESYVKNDVYQVVTDRIIRLLESGTVPWHQPWKGGKNHAPQNFISRKVYRGINFFLLNAARYPSPFWLTFKQVQALDGRVKKGEHSFPVVFWKIFEEQQDGETKRIPFLRYYSVFNAAQCDGLPAGAMNVPTSTTGEFQPVEKCERVVSEMPRPPKIVQDGTRACYSPLHDEVSMPKAELFESSETYYSTLFHELTHATGHLSRLNRKEITAPIHFGSDPYSREELVAEMGAAFLSGHCEIENKTINQSASYIQHWLERLKDDRKLVVHAAAQAQKACDFILDVQHTEDEGPTEYKPKEFKIVALRECATPEEMQLCDTPAKAAAYWKANIATHPHFNPECECFVVLFLNTRRRIRGHQFISVGSLDSVVVHPREVFRLAVASCASAIIAMHNHPSGESQPSEADIRVTRDLIRAGQLLRVELLDHIIVGNNQHSSLRESGFFYS
jgi:antirestriction protein ArdC